MVTSMSGSKPKEIKPREGKWIFHEDIFDNEEDIEYYDDLGDYLYIDAEESDYSLCIKGQVISKLFDSKYNNIKAFIENAERRYGQLQFSLTERHKAEIMLALGGKLLVDLDEVFDILNNWRRS